MATTLRAIREVVAIAAVDALVHHQPRLETRRAPIEGHPLEVRGIVDDAAFAAAVAMQVMQVLRNHGGQIQLAEDETWEDV